MDSATEFLRMLELEKWLTTAHRPIRLRLGYPDHLTDEVLLPQRVQGHEAICGGIDYLVTCVAASPKLPLKELIALPAQLEYVTDRGQLHAVCGIVAEARAGDHDGSLAVYQLRIRDALAIMEKRINSRIFRQQNELQIAQLLFDEWRETNAVLASCFDYEVDALAKARDYPVREQTMQFNESDAAFVRRLLARRGIAWVVRPARAGSPRARAPGEEGQLAMPAHTLLLFDDGQALPASGAGTVRFATGGATQERDTVHSWQAARTLQPGSVSRHSWDYRNPLGERLMSTTVAASHDQGRSGNAMSATLDDYLIDTPHVGLDRDDFWRLGQLRMQRHTFETKCFYGQGSVRDLRAGEYFMLAGHPEVDTHPVDEREFIVTALWIEAENNLPADVAARVRQLMGPLLGGAHGAFEAKPATLDTLRVQSRFAAVRRGTPLVPAFDPRVDFPKAPLVTAIVTGPPGEEVHCDALGRVKIRFPGMRQSDHAHAQGAGASGTAADSAWVRVAMPWAGNGKAGASHSGALLLPRVGSEVLVAFLGGDPDRPVVLGQLYNDHAQPAGLSAAGGLPGNRHLAGLRSREIGGQRGSSLTFDDTPGEIGAQLASDHGNTQLNLGWLAEPRAGGDGAPRGEGAELRSDEAVALHGAKGILVSAGSCPHRSQLERSALLGVAGVLDGLLDELGRLAREHGEAEQAAGRLAQLRDKLRHWDNGTNVAPNRDGGGAPVVALSGAAGVAIASSDSVLVGAQEKVDVVAAGDAEMAAGRNVFVRAGKALSLFAHALGARLVAGQGDVHVQAHQGAIELKASGTIRILSAESIHLEAPEVRIVAGGAETHWGGGDITQESRGTQHVRAGAFDIGVPAPGSPGTLAFAQSLLATDERLVLRDMQTQEPIAHRRYIAHLDDGRVVEGVSDAQGRTALLSGEVIAPVRFEFPDEAGS